MRPYDIEGEEATSSASATRDHPLPAKGALNLEVWDEYNLEVEGEGDYVRLRATSRARAISRSPSNLRSMDQT